MKRLLNAVPALAVLAAGLAGTLAAAPLAHAMDDRVCEQWGKDKITVVSDGHGGELVVVQANCDLWAPPANPPTGPGTPGDPPTQPPKGPAPEPPKPAEPTCKELATQLQGLRERLEALGAQADDLSYALTDDLDAERSAQEDLDDAHDDRVVADREVATLTATYWSDTGLDPVVDVEVHPGFWRREAITLTPSSIDRRFRSGRQLVDALGEQEDAMRAEHAREVGLSDAQVQTARDRATLDAVHDAIEALQKEYGAAAQANHRCQ